MIHCASYHSQVKLFLDIMRETPGIQNVCEIGFNAGHSALTWLSVLPHTRVYSFDLAVHPYVEHAANIIDSM